MIDSELQLVIDGHKIYHEKQELVTTNDVREVYDTNLCRAISDLRENNLFKVPQIYEDDNITINGSVENNSVFVINGNIYEFNTGETLKVKIFANNNALFDFATNIEYQLDENQYGPKISPPKNNNIHYYSNGSDVVLSNTITNKMIKYSSSETIGEHTYTKYYEFFEDKNIGIYLLLIDFKPYKLTTYNYSYSNTHNSFNFVY